MSNFLSPPDVCALVTRYGMCKASLPPSALLLRGIMAGAFIAFASEGSTMAAFNLLAAPDTYGLGRCVAGLVFPTGLMLVVLTGGELFTGNTLMGVAAVQRRITWTALFRNWLWVYGANGAGSLLVAAMMVHSGLFTGGAGLLGGVTVKIALNKVSLTFMQAFILGALCNWLVCLAVWIAYGASDATGKILGVFFPIWLFITSGFEHCIANMYYIPAGILAKSEGAWTASIGFSTEALASLTWANCVLRNLIPVTLGNILGGMVFVGMVHSYAFRNESAGQTKGESVSSGAPSTHFIQE